MLACESIETGGGAAALAVRAKKILEATAAAAKTAQQAAKVIEIPEASTGDFCPTLIEMTPMAVQPLFSVSGDVEVSETDPPFVGVPGSTVQGPWKSREYGDDGYPVTDY